MVGFDKDYPNRKDKRRKYRGSKAVDSSCRNHGSCDYCREGRLYFDKKKRKAIEQDIEEWEEDEE